MDIPLGDAPVILYDTTLRDGTQGENITLSLADKLRIARMLDEYGMPYIEGGWPGSNPKDIEFFAAAKSMTLADREAGGVRVHPSPGQPGGRGPQPPGAGGGGDAGRHDLRQELAAARDRGPGRHARGEPGHDRGVGRRSWPTVAARRSTTRSTTSTATRRTPAYALATLRAARQAGARQLVLCDTNGGTLTDELVRILTATRLALESDPGAPAVTWGIHTHNDAELAVANSIAAVQAGSAPRPGHHQRLRRALRQRQHGVDPRQPGAQDGAAAAARRRRRAGRAHLAVPRRGGDRQRGPQRVAAVRGSLRVRAQGRRPRRGGGQGGALATSTWSPGSWATSRAWSCRSWAGAPTPASAPSSWAIASMASWTRGRCPS